jgi:hypothetical protein
VWHCGASGVFLLHSTLLGIKVRHSNKAVAVSLSVIAMAGAKAAPCMLRPKASAWPNCTYNQSTAQAVTLVSQRLEEIECIFFSPTPN